MLVPTCIQFPTKLPRVDTDVSLTLGGVDLLTRKGTNLKPNPNINPSIHLIVVEIRYFIVKNGCLWELKEEVATGCLDDVCL